MSLNLYMHVYLRTQINKTNEIRHKQTVTIIIHYRQMVFVHIC